MPSLNDVIKEVESRQGNKEGPPVDSYRLEQIQRLSALTGRNVICYYSGWLTTTSNNPYLNIDDMDKNGFMNAVEGMDCDIGLDLVLHTPGGQITAAESLVYYLHQKFGNNIRVIVPQMAMSAGTMITCAAKTIVMGKQSCIGPFDPFVRNVSAFAVLEEFERACAEIEEKPHTLPLWQTMIGKYPPAFLEDCRRAISLASSIVPKWLSNCMFSGFEPQDRDARIEQIMSYLNNPQQTKEHSRHVHASKASELGLVVEHLEDEQDLQDVVLTLHHSFLLTLLNTKAAKIIETQHGKRFLISD